MCNNCGNNVQQSRKTVGVTCVSSSTLRDSSLQALLNVRGKRIVLPPRTTHWSTELSTVFLSPVTLLSRYFSPLSTVPITITQRKER